MKDDDYRLIGKVSIPEDQREEFNRKVLELLWRGGIRKTDTLVVNGIPHTVVRRAEPDEKGIVSFDYSIFEQQIRKPSTFNTITGKLKSEDRGYNEYGIVMNMIMVLTMAYSTSPCMMTYQGKPSNLPGYIALINTLLDDRIVCRNGTDVWDMVELFHQSPDLQDLNPMEAYEVARNNSQHFLSEQFLYALLIDEKQIKLTDKTAEMDLNSLHGINALQYREYLYRFMLQQKDNRAFETWLKKLLKCSYDERMKLAEKKDDFRTAAVFSGFFPAPVLVSVYAKAIGEDFWPVWDRLNVQAYRDYHPLDYPEDDTEDHDFLLPLYKPIWRDSEDEFLEYWDGKEMKLSEELTRQFSLWAEAFRTIEIPSGMNTEKELAGILSDLENIWECRLVDQAFIEEFLDNKDDPDHQKLLLVLREYLYEGAEYFPELTRQQAAEWILSGSRDDHDPVLMSAYVSMMTNHKLRKHIMGV